MSGLLFCDGADESPRSDAVRPHWRTALDAPTATSTRTGAKLDPHPQGVPHCSSSNSGSGDGSFLPDRPVERRQLVVMLFRLLTRESTG